ncbi:MAG: hypothetical protein AVDCRST_MAG68-3013, partial [uncultured Gemmatimonadetes bacterium]
EGPRHPARERRHPRGGGAHALDAAGSAALRRGAHRQQAGVRQGRLRRVHRVDRRGAGAVVHRARVRGRRARGEDGGGAGGLPHGAGDAAPAAGRLRRVRRGAVRLLHAGDPDERGGAAGREHGAHARRDPRGALRQPVPVHRLHQDPGRGGAGGGAHARSHAGGDGM